MLIAVVAWLVLATAPGLAILRLSRARWGRWSSLAAAPTLGFGSLYVVALAATALGLPAVTAATLFAICLIIAWVVFEFVIAGRWRPSAMLLSVRSRAATLFIGRPSRIYVSWLLAGAAVVFGTIIWLIALNGIEFPPGWDAMHHGYFTRQILDFQTLDSATVLSSTPSDNSGESSFYPLIFNLLTAMVSAVPGLPVSQVMLAGIVTIGSVFMPITVYALSRKIAPDLPLAAGLAAAIVPFPLVTYAIIGTGRDNTVLALAVVLGCAIVLLGDGPRWKTAALSALSLIGIIGLHTSEFPVAIFVAGSIGLVGGLRTRSFAALGKWIIWSVAATLAALAALVVLEPAILTSVSSRQDAMVPNMGVQPAPFVQAVGSVVKAGWTLSSGTFPVLQILIIVGLVMPIFIRKLRPFIASTVYYCVFALLMVGLYTQGLGPLAFLAAPWYEDVSRLAWTFAIMAAIPAAVGAVALLEPLAGLAVRAIARTGRDRVIRVVKVIAPIAVSTIALVALSASALPNVATSNLEFKLYFSPASTDSRAAFNYLQKHIAADDVVMDDLRISGSLWMYDDYSVRPLFGNAPYLGAAPKSWKERMWLVAHLSQIDTDPCVAAMLDKYRIRYVYYDEATMSDGVRQITLPLLNSHHQFAPYFTSGKVAVYSVTLPDTIPTCTRDVSLGISWN